MRGNPNSLHETAFKEKDVKTIQAYKLHTYLHYKCRMGFPGQYYKVSLTSSGLFFFPKKGWQKLEIDITSKYRRDSPLHMLYKLLNGNFPIFSF